MKTHWYKGQKLFQYYKEKRKRVKTKSNTPETKNKSGKLSKRLKTDQLQKQSPVLIDKIFHNWKA